MGYPAGKKLGKALGYSPEVSQSFSFYVLERQELCECVFKGHFSEVV